MPSSWRSAGLGRLRYLAPPPSTPGWRRTRTGTSTMRWRCSALTRMRLSVVMLVQALSMQLRGVILSPTPPTARGWRLATSRRITSLMLPISLWASTGTPRRARVLSRGTGPGWSMNFASAPTSRSYRGRPSAGMPPLRSGLRPPSTRARLLRARAPATTSAGMEGTWAITVCPPMRFRAWQLLKRRRRLWHATTPPTVVRPGSLDP